MWSSSNAAAATWTPSCPYRHANLHTRTFPSSPQRSSPAAAVLPTLLLRKDISNVTVRVHRSNCESGARNRQRVRENAERREASQRKAHTSGAGASTQAPPSPTAAAAACSAAGFRKASSFPVAAAGRATPQKDIITSLTTPAATATSPTSTPSSVLLRHTFHGTTRILYADGHVETFTSSDVAAAAANLPAVRRTGPKLLKGPKRASQSPAVAAAATGKANNSNLLDDNDAKPRVKKPLLPFIMDATCNAKRSPSSCSASSASPVVLRSYEAAAQVYKNNSPHHHSPFTLNGHSAEASKTAASAMMLSSYTSTPLPFQAVRTSSGTLAGTVTTHTLTPDVVAPAATAVKKETSHVNRTVSIAPTTSPMETARSSVFARRNEDEVLQTVGLATDLLPPLSLELNNSDGNARGPLDGQEREDSDEGAFLLTSVPVEVPPLLKEDTVTFDTVPHANNNSSPITNPSEVVQLLHRLQQDVRRDFASDQRIRAKSFTRRFERPIHDSPSLFSLFFSFRPLEEIYKENVQLNGVSVTTGTSTTHDGLRGPMQRQQQSQTSTAAATAANAVRGVPDILLPAAQTTTPMGWTVPELIGQRLLPRETPALQHRFRELLALRGILDAPDTTTCRFFVAFLWFVLLRCRKAHREQSLVDGYRRLSKAFADVFPLSSRDTLPTLDVLGQLLVEMFTCSRFVEKASEIESQRQYNSPTVPVSPMMDALAATTTMYARGGTAHREGPDDADITSLLSQKDFFPLLTGEWSYLLRHGNYSADAASNAVTAGAPSTFDSFSRGQQPSFDPSGYEQGQKKLSNLPSHKALQTLLAVYQELWLLHSKYVELCLYEEELYKQLAVLFCNLSVQVAHAAAGLSAADTALGAAETTEATTASVVNSAKPRKWRASSALNVKSVSVGDSNPHLTSRISVNLTQLTSFGLHAAAAASPATTDSILDSLLAAVAHATYYTCVFCFPNDVYAGLFDEEFRMDVVQWLSYCCHGVVTTHVQTKQWPVPSQTDYDAAQKLRSAAEKRELTALGLQNQENQYAFSAQEGNEVGDAAPLVFSSGDDASRTVSRSSRGGEGNGNAACMFADSTPKHSSANNANSSSSAVLETAMEESLDLEGVVANAEFRLAHQFDHYSRAAAQHVSELERRMGRLQRRHRLTISSNGGIGNPNNGTLRRARNGLHNSRRGSLAALSRGNHSATFNTDDDDPMGTSTHSISSVTSRLTSFREAPQHPSTPATRGNFTLDKDARPSSIRNKNKNETINEKRCSTESAEKRNVAPSFPVLSVSAAVLPSIAADVDVSTFPSPIASTAPGKAATASERSRQKPNSIFNGKNTHTSSINNSNNNGVSWHGADAELRTPATPHPPQSLSSGLPCQTSSRPRVNSGVRGGYATKGGGGVVNAALRSDPRDMYRTSAFVENDKSLVTLAAELNHAAVRKPSGSATASDVTRKLRAGDAVSKRAGKHLWSTSPKHNDADTSNNGVFEYSSASADASHLSNSASTPAAPSLLSSYPLCTCPVPITEYWLAMALRVSSWSFRSSTAALRNADFTLYVSPAAAALQDENLYNTNDHLDGCLLAQSSTAPHSTVGVAAATVTAAAEPSKKKQGALSPSLYILEHEPWRGLYGRVVAVPPISGAAQRAAKLVDTLAESLPHQQTLVYQALRSQELRHDQRFFDSAFEVPHHRLLDGDTSSQQRLWNGLMDASNASVVQPGNAFISTSRMSDRAVIVVETDGVATAGASTAAPTTFRDAAAVVQQQQRHPQPNLGTATIPFISPFTSELANLTAPSQFTLVQSVASYLRRRGIGETYQGYTSPFFQLYTSTCLMLALPSGELSLLRESLNIARDDRREKALLRTSSRVDHNYKNRHPSNNNSNATSNMTLLSQSFGTLGPSHEIHEQQLLSSLLPVLPIAAAGTPTPTLAALDGGSTLLIRDTAAAAPSMNLRGVAVAAAATPLSSRSLRKLRRSGGLTASAITSAFAITAIPREEARLRPCRMRPLQEEALRRRAQLLMDMDTIEKRDGAARQNYVVQQLRVANAMAQLKTDTMLRRYRVRGRLALERLEVEEGDPTGVREGGD